MEKLVKTVLLCAGVSFFSLSSSYAMNEDAESTATAGVSMKAPDYSTQIAQVEDAIAKHAKSQEVPSDDPDAREIPTDLHMRQLLAKKAALFEAAGDLDHAIQWQEVLVAIGRNTRDGSLEDYSDTEYETQCRALAALEMRRGNEGKAKAVLDQYTAYVLEKLNKVTEKKK